MEPEHLKEMQLFEAGYWWHIAKRILVKDTLLRFCPPPAKLLEGGVGTGENLRHFKNMGYKVSGFDSMPESCEYCSGKNIDILLHDIETLWPLTDEPVDIVVLLDVLEHLDHPAKALKNAYEGLSAGGHVIATVPAYSFLMGPWDEMLGHKRRYSKRLLAEHAREAGFEIEWLSYWNSFSFPCAIAIRLAEKVFCRKRSADLPKVSPFLNLILLKLAFLERLWIKCFPLPFGLSIIGVFSKK